MNRRRIKLLWFFLIKYHRGFSLSRSDRHLLYQYHLVFSCLCYEKATVCIQKTDKNHRSAERKLERLKTQSETCFTLSKPKIKNQTNKGKSALASLLPHSEKKKKPRERNREREKLKERNTSWWPSFNSKEENTWVGNLVFFIVDYWL
jgi:hypothetical protein